MRKHRNWFSNVYLRFSKVYLRFFREIKLYLRFSLSKVFKSEMKPWLELEILRTMLCGLWHTIEYSMITLTYGRGEYQGTSQAGATPKRSVPSVTRQYNGNKNKNPPSRTRNHQIGAEIWPIFLASYFLN